LLNCGVAIPVVACRWFFYTGGFKLCDGIEPDYAESDMTIDKSLRVKRGAARNRSVLTRVERIQRLREADKWSDEKSPFGLPKVRVRKMTIKKKKKKKEDEEGAAAEGGAAPAAGAAAPAAAAGAKGAAGSKTPAAAKPAAGKPAAKK
jgi:small basic protein (TIGR04137 family)